MATRSTLYTTRAWRSLRLRVLARDGHTCQIGGPSCTGHATQVDHIVPRSVDPDRAMDVNNLRAACAECNQQLGGKLGAAMARHPSGRHRRARADRFDAW